MRGLIRRELRQPDGRRLYLYGDHDPALAGYVAPRLAAGEYQRRWNPLRREWILVAVARQDRTFLADAADCPLCPSRPGHSTEIPASRYQLAVFENRFPAMPGFPFRARGGGQGGGTCEVVVYTEQHVGSMATLGKARIRELIDVWTDRYRELAARPDVQYVLIFENRGEAVGVTLHHPHGQIYAYPFIPPIAKTELQAGRAFARAGKGCLQCSLIASERSDGSRMLFDVGGVAAYVPSYARWPYEVHLAPRTHYGALPDLPARSRLALAEALSRITSAYDRLFDQPLPYMMVIHQRPTDRKIHPSAHLRVEFYPVMRGPGRLKYLAAGENGAGTFVSDSLPEEKASQLRAQKT
jgi:UDPglucose--hexose-1-phosphate uridylyltransferase